MTLPLFAYPHQNAAYLENLCSRILKEQSDPNRFAVYSKFQNVVRVHYSHLTKEQAQSEVDRMNSQCSNSGHPAIYWLESHHPECVFSIS